MTSFLEKADKSLRDKAEAFIARIKSKEIRKRTLPNVSKDFPVEKAFESFDNLTKSKDYQNMIRDAYK